MNKLLMAVICVSLGHAGVAAAQAEEVPDQAAEQPAEPPDAVQPPTPAPGQLPPAPPAQPPAPPQDAAEQQTQVPGAQAPGQATGQWVYTGQYGWVFMPYGDQYVYEGNASDQYPYSYVYYPTYGWAWLAAPWLWGWGAYPYFGVRGPSRYSWHHGLYRSGYGWGRYRGGGPSRGFSSAPGARVAPQGAPRANYNHVTLPGAGFYGGSRGSVGGRSVGGGRGNHR
jgi:hypothetical protein